MQASGQALICQWSGRDKNVQPLLKNLDADCTQYQVKPKKVGSPKATLCLKCLQGKRYRVSLSLACFPEERVTLSS